jgi:hypothetical protein
MSAVLEELSALRAEIAALRTDVQPRARPLTSWRAVAAALGVSEDTVLRRRRAVRDASAPWFRDADAAIAWWQKVRTPRRPRVLTPRKVG